MLGRRAMSSIAGIMAMAVLLSLSLNLFTLLSSSLTSYSNTLSKELDIATEIIAEEKVAVEASSNGTHVLLSLTNKVNREVVFPYIVFKHEGELLQTNRVDFRVPPLSTVQYVVDIPQGSLNPLLEVVLIAKRGSIHRVALSSMVFSNSNSNEPYVKVPYYDMCLINDVDTVDHLKGIVVASYENGGVLMIDVKQSALLWSKEFLGSRTESVMFNAALNATIASISTIRESGAKMLSIVAFKDGKLLSIHNFYDYIHRSSSVREYVHQPALSGRNQELIFIPKSFFLGNYSTNNYWLFESGVYVHIFTPSLPSVKEVLLQRVLILDLNTGIVPSYYQSNPDVFPKFRVVGYAPVNQSFSVLLVNGVLYREVDVVYVRHRCNIVVLEGNVLVPPTLHALNNGSPSWYLSLYPCDLSVPNFLAYANNVIVVASGPYLYLVNIDGQVVKRIDCSPEKIVFLKFNEHYRRLIIGFTNGSIAILNENLAEEKSFSLSPTLKIIDVVLIGNLKVIVLNETHVFNPEDSSFIVELPSKPYKATVLDMWGVLVASPSGLLYLKT